MESQSAQEQKSHHSIDTVERFFALIDSGSLFAKSDPLFHRKLRSEVRSALGHLLLRGRPTLEITKGLSWPYEGLRERFHTLKKLAEQENDPALQQQALFFLALLPFPKQWSYLFKVENLYRDDKEISAFLSEENHKIHDRLQKKVQKEYKLRHFCQVLKAPGVENDKGILRIFAIPYLLADPGLLPQLSSRYILYVEPPWGVVFRHTWLRNLAKAEDPCVFGVATAEDIHFLNSQFQIVPTPLAHGDYLSENVAVPLDQKKEYDIVFNGTFDDMPRKRHELMLELLNHHLLRDKRALFLGRGRDKNVEQFRSLVERAELAGRITVVANILRLDVPSQLSHCRMAVHLSLNENGCRSLYEFFRSDLPVVISSSMAGTNLEIFNAQTGMAVTDNELPEAISFVLSHRDQFAPRLWFLENSGSWNSTQKLNRSFKRLFKKLGYQWQDDIVPLLSGGPNRYANPSDYERFREEFLWIFNCLKSAGNIPIRFTVD
jgi:hypothetical protein